MTARGEETRRVILASAERLLAEHGIHGTTIEQIAQDAHVGVGTIYTHFAGKPGIALHFVASGLDALDRQLREARTAESPIARVLAAGDAYFRFAVDHPIAARYAAVRVLEPDPSPEYAEVNAVCTARVRGMVLGVAEDVREAMTAGEVPVRPMEETMIYLWGVWNGVAALVMRRDELAVSPAAGQRALDFARAMLRTANERDFSALDSPRD